MSDDIKIEHNVPIPEKGNSAGITAALRKLKVGDSFVIPVSKRNSVSSYHRLGIKIAIRIISKTELRVWRIK